MLVNVHRGACVRASERATKIDMCATFSIELESCSVSTCACLFMPVFSNWISLIALLIDCKTGNNNKACVDKQFEAKTSEKNHLKIEHKFKL